MTSTSFNVGLGAVSRNTSKVLKPPGGGSSDIFGTAQEPEPQQRKGKQHLHSSIFGGEETQTPARNKAESTQAATNVDKVESAVNGSSSASSVASTPASAPAAAPAPPASAAAPARQRIPPGGFSSGLW